MKTAIVVLAILLVIVLFVIPSLPILEAVIIAGLIGHNRYLASRNKRLAARTPKYLQ